MKYISLGAVMEPSTEHIVKVSHCGIDYTLTQELASLWLDGRFGFAEAESPIEMRALNQLYRMGLVVTADESDAGEYRALTHCTMKCLTACIITYRTSRGTSVSINRIILKNHG